MNTLKTSLFAVAGFVILVGALVLSGLQPKEVESQQLKTVIVGNTAASPVPVTDGVTRTIFQEARQMFIPDMSTGVSVNFTPVPAGQILVIETVSILLITPTTDQLPSQGNITITGTGVSHFFPIFEVAEPIFSGSRFVGFQHLRMYGNAGNTPTMSIQRTPTAGQANIFANISGYLIPDTSPSLSP